MPDAECKNCGAALEDDSAKAAGERIPCPECGSIARHYKKSLAATACVQAGVRGVAYSESKSKWFAKFRSELSFFRRGGVWVRRYMHLDKKADSYVETVTDPASGLTIHHCSEPLSEHTGHGSARAIPERSDAQPADPAGRAPAG